MKILCDLDSIVADIFTPWLETYNREFNDTLTTAQVATYHIENYVRPEARKAIFDIIKRPGFFRNLKPLPGAIGALRQLDSDGHDIYIVTATGHAEGAAEKFAWVQEHMPFVHKHNIFVCWTKEMVQGDVFIDDSPKNIKAYRKAWPDAHIVTIAYPYNDKEGVYTNLRAESWQDPVEAWHQISKYIQEVSR